MQDRPLGLRTQVATLGDTVFVGTEDSAYVNVLRLSSSQEVGRIHPGIQRRKPTRSNYERAIDRRVAWLTDKADRERWRKRFLAMPMPDYLPAYSALFADPDGERLWVQISIPGDSTTALRAVGLDGKIQGDVTLQQDLTVFDVAHGYILGEYDDSGGDQHVVLYKIPDTLQQIADTAGRTRTP